MQTEPTQTEPTPETTPPPEEIKVEPQAEKSPLELRVDEVFSKLNVIEANQNARIEKETKERKHGRAVKFEERKADRKETPPQGKGVGELLDTKETGKERGNNSSRRPSRLRLKSRK